MRESFKKESEDRVVHFKRGTWLLLILVFFLFFGIGSAIGLTMVFFQHLPQVGNLEEYRPPLMTRIYSANDELIAQLYEEKRIWVPLSKVPQHLQNAVIAIEDKRFYKHLGIDPRGVARAILENIRAGKIVEGGSTITQQLAKTRFLTQEKTLSRKIMEMMLALLYERKYTKKQILEHYFNQIYFGHGAYGVEAAARTYFNKPIDKLNLAECAMLASLPRAPGAYSPYINPKSALKRQALILDKMVALGYLTPKEAAEAKGTSLILQKLKPGENKAPYFVEYVRQQLENKYGENIVYKGGLSVYTTLDLKMQEAAQRALKRGLEVAEDISRKTSESSPKLERSVRRTPLQGAIIAIEPQTGYIKALVGGRDFSESEFNRALQAKRQPGSAFKPFIYTAAINNGFTPASIILDAPVVFNYRGEDWKPQNFEGRFFGPTTLREALVKSRNVCTVKILEKVGVSTAIDYARRLGINTEFSPDLTLALGTSEVTLLEMASAFGVFANQGIRVEPIAIRYIQDSQDNILEENVPQVREVLTPESAFIMTSLMRDVIDRGTARVIRQMGFDRPAAGKTGSTHNFNDAWFIGYVPNLSTGVWVGFDDRRSLGKNLTGGVIAAPIWTNFMKEALEGTPVQDFPVPENISLVRIDSKSGLLATEECHPENVIEEAFVKGTEPTQYCHIHKIRGEFLREDLYLERAQPAPLEKKAGVEPLPSGGW